MADIAYLLQEGAPSTMPFWGPGLQPAPPAGYDYDYVNADVVLHRMSVGEDGRLVLPDGMSYRVLVLPDVDSMTLPLVRKIRKLVAVGGTVIGRRPSHTPGSPVIRMRIASCRRSPAISGAISTASAARGESTGRKSGMGSDRRLRSSIRSDVPVDFESSRALDATVAWMHRRAGEPTSTSSRTERTRPRYPGSLPRQRKRSGSCGIPTPERSSRRAMPSLTAASPCRCSCRK